jgi:hypothetical protein
MSLRSDQQLAQLVEQLQQSPGLVAQLPGEEGDMARRALDGQSVYEIAQAHTTSEDAVWSVLQNAALAASGQSRSQPVESGGMGSDTDPGVSGGYGATAMGSLESEPPDPLIKQPGEDE